MTVTLPVSGCERKTEFQMSISIGVIVPFYKIDYFENLLNALSDQTDSMFTVFIGNDASDPAAEDLCIKFREVLDIKYHFFCNRMGHIDLAKQWNRCVFLAGDVDWIWVVPDDDLPSPECIAEIRASAIVADEVCANVIHIPCITIDGRGDRRGARDEWPAVINSAEFYLRQIRGDASGMSLANAVYRRSAFDAAGQFMSLPKGWGSDHATTLAVAAGGPIVTVPRAWLGFRMSGHNISSMSDDGYEKLRARLSFALWLANKVPEWYGSDVSRQLLRWFYLKGELYVTQVWPFSIAMASGLFKLAEICGVRRTPLQKTGIIARGWFNTIKRKQAA